MSGITLLGLGPGNPAHLTREAWEVLSSAKEVWLRTAQHPVVHGLPSGIELHTFDDLYETHEHFETVYATIIEKILNLGQEAGGVIYAVPGDPFVAESTCPEIARRAKEMNLQVKVINGLSFLEPVFSALGQDPFPHLVLLDALELGDAHVPNFPPDLPALVAQIYSRLVASEVKMTLGAVYPDEHPVKLVHAAGTTDEQVEEICLYEIDRSERIGLLSVLFLPALGKGTSLEAFQEVVAHLRAPDGCPWDREQTHQSLRSHLIEESYEALEAMDSDDPEAMAEEFGDLLLQIVLNAQIGHENGDFNMVNVLRGVHDKIIRRHPHVFGDLTLNTVDGVLSNWEKLKADERAGSQKPEKGALDGIPRTLPALIQALEYQDRAARVGFDWPEISGVLDKIMEEIGEIRATEDEEELSAEVGDLFFALVNFSRWKKIDAETALRGTNQRFKKRFVHIEKTAKKQGRKLQDLTLDEMEALWNEAKQQE